MVDSLLLAAALLGCGGTPRETHVPISRSRSYTRAVDTLGAETIVAAAAARVWAVLPAVYTDLGLQINFRNPEERRSGTCYQPVRGRLGKELLSTFVDCGETRAVPNADRHEVALTVLSTVLRIDDRFTAIRTYVLGVAVDASGVSQQRIWCFSRGALEERIRAAVEARLAG
jgi:hypothetical protein